MLVWSQFTRNPERPTSLAAPKTFTFNLFYYQKSLIISALNLANPRWQNNSDSGLRRLAELHLPQWLGRSRVFQLLQVTVAALVKHALKVIAAGRLDFKLLSDRFYYSAGLLWLAVDVPEVVSPAHYGKLGALSVGYLCVMPVHDLGIHVLPRRRPPPRDFRKAVAVILGRQANALIERSDDDVRVASDRVAEVLPRLHPAHENKVASSVYPVRVYDPDVVRLVNTKAVKDTAVFFNPFSIWQEFPYVLQEVAVAAADVKVDGAV